MSGFAARIMRVMPVRLAAAAGYAGMAGALRLRRMLSARTGFLRLAPVLVARARTAEALRTRVLGGHFHRSC
jgi:hypothetical protein